MSYALLILLWPKAFAIDDLLAFNSLRGLVSFLLIVYMV